VTCEMQARATTKCGVASSGNSVMNHSKSFCN
jgi:hypothetical protein